MSQLARDDTYLRHAHSAGRILQAMKFVVRLEEKDGAWIAGHPGPDIGPNSVTAGTRAEALRKLQAEIRYWLEMCPCSGRTYEDADVELIEFAAKN